MTDPARGGLPDRRSGRRDGRSGRTKGWIWAAYTTLGTQTSRPRIPPIPPKTSRRHIWESVSADRVRKVESLIKGYHTTIGGQLCALTVKIQAWARAFPSKNAGGPARRAEFLMSEMRQGIERVRVFEANAPSLSALR